MSYTLKVTNIMSIIVNGTENSGQGHLKFIHECVKFIVQCLIY